MTNFRGPGDLHDTESLFCIKGLAMQIEKTLINDRLCVSKVT